MMKHLLKITCACVLLIAFLTSCSTSKKSSYAYKGSHPPRFIKGIYLDGHNKSNVTANAIEPRKAPKYVAVPKPDRTVTKDQSAQTDRNSITDNSRPLVVPSDGGQGFDMGSDDLVGVKYADMMGLDSHEICNHELYRFIDKWYGTNYRLGGESEAGIDCSAFSKRLYGEVYGMDITRTAMEQFKSCICVKRNDNAEEGDLVFFRQRSKRISHVGVYLANDYFIHASSSGVMISNLKEEYWKRRYAGVGKVKKGEKL